MGTGSSAGNPSNGSRTIEEKKLLAALFGRPGRTMIVGSRSDTASMNPRRVASASTPKSNLMIDLSELSMLCL